jgi:hypothetical protein
VGSYTHNMYKNTYKNVVEVNSGDMGYRFVHISALTSDIHTGEDDDGVLARLRNLPPELGLMVLAYEGSWVRWRNGRYVRRLARDDPRYAEVAQVARPGSSVYGGRFHAMVYLDAPGRRLIVKNGWVRLDDWHLQVRGWAVGTEYIQYVYMGLCEHFHTSSDEWTYLNT